MKTKASWKPVGHSAKRWGETTRRGGPAITFSAPPPRKKGAKTPVWVKPK